MRGYFRLAIPWILICVALAGCFSPPPPDAVQARATRLPNGWRFELHMGYGPTPAIQGPAPTKTAPPMKPAQALAPTRTPYPAYPARTLTPMQAAQPAYAAQSQAKPSPPEFRPSQKIYLARTTPLPVQPGQYGGVLWQAGTELEFMSLVPGSASNAYVKTPDGRQVVANLVDLSAVDDRAYFEIEATGTIGYLVAHNDAGSGAGGNLKLIQFHDPKVGDIRIATKDISSIRTNPGQKDTPFTIELKSGNKYNGKLGDCRPTCSLMVLVTPDAIVTLGTSDVAIALNRVAR